MRAHPKAAPPIVECPGCKTPMRLMTMDHASGSLSVATYRCETCGTETKRHFKSDEPDQSSTADGT
jgi:hypothetical protein